MKFTLVDAEERNKNKCYFCGKQGKYKEESINMYFCNTCYPKLIRVHDLLKLFN